MPRIARTWCAPSPGVPSSRRSAHEKTIRDRPHFSRLSHRGKTWSVPESRPMNWVGRSLRRFEDRALLLGRGRFTADTPGEAGAVRFARSPVARGRIRSISRPEGALVFTAADLVEVKPIRPLLHRPDYVPIAQPVLARE